MTLPELIRELAISEAKRFDSSRLEKSHLLAVLAYRFMIKYDTLDSARNISKKNIGKNHFSGKVSISDELESIIQDCKTKENISEAFSILKNEVLGNTNESELLDGSEEIIDFETAFAELEQLIGLKTVKDRLHKVFAMHQTNQKRIEKGLDPVDVTHHLVFTGAPGTGKTTVARIVAKLYRSIGILPKGHLVETGRNDLVAGYVGQTALKVDEVVKAAMGGVLFIDEAYSLTQDEGRGNDFGREAIATLLKMMEDKRGQFAVIVAGYTKEMEKFISSNPGLKSRFSTVIDFPDYSAEELLLVFSGLCAQNKIGLSSDVEKLVLEHFRKTKTTGDSGNARYVRSLFENMFANMSLRAFSSGIVETKAIEMFIISDFPDILTIKEISRPFGFAPNQK
jgi:stage V sporulation protein K